VTRFLLTFGLFGLCWLRLTAQISNTPLTFPGLSAAPTALVAGNGYVIAGGSFAGPTSATGAATLWNKSTGIVGLGIQGSVSAAISDGTGGWLVGGQFDTVAGQLRKNLARVNASGQLQPFQANINGLVSSLLVKGDTLFVGGLFNLVNGTARRNLAAFSLSTSSLLNWSPEPLGPVWAMERWNDTLFIGGSFFQVDTFLRRNIAAVTASANDTGIVLPLRMVVDATVFCMARNDTSLFFGGAFTAVDSLTRYRIAEYSLAKQTILPLQANLNGTAYAIALSDRSIFVGGTFSTAGTSSVVRRGLASFYLRNKLLSGFSLDTVSGTVSSLSVWHDTLWLGGSITRLRSTNVGRISALDTAGSKVFSSIPFTDEPVSVVRGYAGGVLFGGDFSHAGQTGSQNLAAWTTTASNTPVKFPLPDGPITALAQSGNLVFAAGEFDTLAGGFPRMRLGAYNLGANPSVTTWRLTDTIRTPKALAADEGRLYVGSGSSVLAYSQGASTRFWRTATDSIVLALTTSGNHLYVGGLSKSNANFLAEYDTSTGQRDLSLTATLNGPVTALFATGDTLFVGGRFDTINGASRARVAAFRISDNTLLPWTVRLDTQIKNSAYVQVSAIQPIGNDVILAGNFLRSDTFPVAFLAGFNRNSGALLQWRPTINGPVSALARVGDTLIAGGDFESADGVSAPFLAAFRIRAATAIEPVQYTRDVLVVYPNPVRDRCTAELKSGIKLEKLELFDLQGRSVMSADSFSSTELDLRNLPSGLYYLRATTQQGIFAAPLLKE
jgi:trimeric autotransporter adhesin